MGKDRQELFRSLPSVDSVIGLPEAAALCDRHGRSLVVETVRRILDDLRAAILEGGGNGASAAAVIAQAGVRIDAAHAPKLGRVVNATGIILHTGLGRAIMPGDAAVPTGYCNIQMDLETGERIKRETNIRQLVVDLTGAEDVLLVNNNAGATLLVLKALAEGKEAIVSRGELIEIGGSFRLPEIMAQSGAIMREVGATNKTHLKDYQKAIGDRTGLLFKAHKSNYQIVGFTKEVGIAELAALGREHGVPVIDDLGCGALVALEPFGMEHEMTIRESLEAGADIVLSSTDKLIGGPQGGLIVGRGDLLESIRSHPLYRALRVCKMTLAALEATLRLFREPELLAEKHPVYRMMAKPLEVMKAQAEDLAERIRERKPSWSVTVAEEASYLGGGSLPSSSLPSIVVALAAETESTNAIAAALRRARIPVIPHVKDDAVILNMRTVAPGEVEDILAAVS